MERPMTDLRRAVRAAFALSLTETESPGTWRSALRIARHLKRESEALVDRNWKIILTTANLLLREKQIDGHRVREIIAWRKLLHEESKS
jgi:hypothetical protein